MTDLAHDVAPPAPSRDRAIRSAGWWGAVLFIAVLAVVTGVLVYAYVQLAVKADRWPPEGIEAPPTTPLVVSGLMLVASAAAVWFAGHAYGSGKRAPMVVSLAATVAIGVAAGALVAKVLADEDSVPADHAYASLVALLGWFLLLLVASGVVVLVVVAVRAAKGPHDIRLHVVVDVARLLWWTVVAIGVVVVATLTLGARL